MAPSILTSTPSTTVEEDTKPNGEISNGKGSSSKIADNKDSDDPKKADKGKKDAGAKEKQDTTRIIRYDEVSVTGLTEIIRQHANRNTDSTIKALVGSWLKPRKRRKTRRHPSW
jgi:hypothetical protein